MSQPRKKRTKDDYKAHIAVATPIQLVVITYDILLDNVETAMAANTEDAFSESVSRADKALSELVSSLDMDIEISKQLLQIYEFMHDLLLSAEFGNHQLEVVKKNMSHLYSGWKVLEQAELSGNQKASAKQVFSGLTYGRDGKLDEYIDDSSSKDYKV